MSYNLGIQHELPHSVIIDVGYVGNLGRHLTRSININQLREGTRLNPPASNTNVNALRPYLGYGNINVRDQGDNSNYNSLQIAVTRRLRQGLSLTANYTFSKTLDDTSGTPQDAYNSRCDYALSAVHRAHVVNINYIYELPFFGRHHSALVRNVLAGWEISGVTFYQSGAPNTVSVPVDVARTGAGSTRASVVGNPNLPGDQRTLAHWFNTEAFLAPERMVQGQFGNSGRNVLIGPGFNQWDMSVVKNFRFDERRSLQFRTESFNIFNHPSFTGLNTTVRFDASGKPTQSYGAVNASGPGRVLELGLKLLF